MRVSEKEAEELLRLGYVVGIPTDTVYGFSVLEECQNKIYNLKKRDRDKKLITFVSTTKQIGKVDEFNEEELIKLSEKYWPGANTLIFKQLGVWESYRIPKEPNTLNFLKKLDLKVLTTSANISGESPVLSESEFEQRFPEIPVLEKRQTSFQSGKPSTVMKITQKKVKIIRK